MPTRQAEWSSASIELSDLLARTGIGDRGAFAALYQRSSAHLFAVILRINRDRAQAEDILQEVYLAVWRAASAFDAARSQPLTWLTSIARNRAIDSLRRAASQPALQVSQRHDDEDDDVYDQTADDSPGPLELLTQSAEARKLRDCLQELSAAQRHSLALAYFDGLTHAEIAGRMQQPLGSVKSWVRRGLQSLKPCLERGRPGD
jgi:RNA polymerase sigma factor (sigma-70 family)